MAAPKKSYDQGVVKKTISFGDGKTYPKAGDNLTMHYTGTFYGGPKDGYAGDT